MSVQPEDNKDVEAEAATTQAEDSSKPGNLDATAADSDETTAPEEPQPGDELAFLRAENEKLKADTASLNDQYLRKVADFENFRKRTIKEKQDSIQYANAALLQDILTVIDDFERAIKSAASSSDFKSFYDGIALIEKQFVGLLERNWGLTRFEAAGSEFDPQKHEAIAMTDSNEHASTVVIEDYQKGYMLHDRVLRPAKVRVARPAQCQMKSKP